jgi:acyl carrier protein
MNAQTQRTIKEHIAQEFLRDRPDFELTDDTNLLEANILDSLGIFTLLNFLEAHFHVQIEPDEVTLENFETISLISQMIDSKRGSDPVLA